MGDLGRARSESFREQAFDDYLSRNEPPAVLVQAFGD